MKGNGTVFKRGQLWCIAYYDNGRECRQSSDSRKHKDAVKLLRLRLGEVAFGVPQSAAPKRARVRAVRMLDLFDLLEERFRLKGIAKGNNVSYLKRLRRRFAG